ncbi:UNVERIFIED_CONTAM: hypothetical protein RMT77_010211 [Armadillidium vulgare]
MNVKYFLILFLFTSWCEAAFVKRFGPNASELPNFIIMLMDDMGWGDLGCNGEPNKETPNIDGMSREGMTVANMYTANPLCSPSRASLLTGRLPIRNGFYQTNIDGRNSYTPQEIVGGIPDSEILLSELLEQKNYTNVLIGKWHLGHQSQYLPLKHGFHHQFGSTNCHFGPYDNVSTPNIPVFRDDKMLGRYYQDFVIDRTTGESNLTRMYTEEAVNFIQGRLNQENPFFMLWTPDSTHAPTFASQDFLHTSRRKTYGAATKELDAGVGSILAALDEVGLTNNTFVVFTSDNGPALVSKFDGGSNGPFLCGKQTTFEGGMRAPGIFYWPGTIPAGTTTHQVWTHMDLFSTLLELAGIDLPDDRFIDGLPLSRSLDDPDLEFLRPVFFYRGNRLMAVRLGSYKMHLWTWNTTPEELEEGTDYCPGQKSVNVTTSEPFDHSASPLLYAIETDPGEKYPISPNSEEYQQNIDALLAAVEEHEAELVAGEPQLNWCDRAVMHWSPPGCEEIGQCLTVPESDPYLCDWPH